MKRTSRDSELLRRAALAALTAVGLRESDIIFSGNRIEIAPMRITVSPALDGAARVWRVDHAFKSRRIEDGYEQSAVTRLFSVPLGEDLMLVRKLATHVATARIDGAIDAAVAGGLRS